MTKSEMAAALNEKSAWLPGKRVKLDFGSEGVVMLDGARWTAVAARGIRIERGATVEVLAVEGVRVIVGLPPAASSAPSSPPSPPATSGDAA